MLYETGIVTDDLLEAALPSPERRGKGPYAVIECFQEIPCNPCTISCPFDAILPMEDINDLPELVPDLCTGCGICAGVCPGLAIFIIDESRGDGTARVTIPYEFVPLPEKGEVVQAVDRAGAYVADATVTRVLSGKKSGTPQVTLSVPLDCAQKVRFFHLIKEQDVKLDAESEKEPREDQQVTAEATIICRCEGITVGDIRKLIEEGYTTVDEIKRISRAGMGPCQARTCGPLIADLIARMTGRPVEEVEPSAHRPPTRSLPISFFMEEEEDVLT
ncbi:MAG TPA: (2Fe-2S)-binding protein [Bacillota bacterium]|jgi:Fe-S-cluster-containing hydrogenase component 2|nr:4Fe-4S binding protein [Fastidiosipila sp.]HPX93836.1 (2Fe-2S)-binding protein [Bacillota bacterium]HQB81702.1 (2Fe-2S)-binding protein [Bacillota bacterium]